MKKICMVGPNCNVKGGITTVINGYKNSEEFNSRYDVDYYSSCISGNIFNKLVYMIAKLFCFYFIALFKKYEIVHIHMAFGMSFFRKKMYLHIAKRFGAKVILHIHGAEWDAFYNNATRAKKEKIIKAFNKSDLIIVLSDEWKNRLIDINIKTKIKVVPNFVSIKKEDIIRKEHKNFNISFVGEICDRKGCFNIKKIIPKEMYDRLKVYIGGNGESDKMKRYLSDDNGLNVFKYLGYLDYDQKVKLFQITDLFLFPSYNEGVPMVLLEAMSFGIPCVSTNVGGIPSLINNDYLNGNLYEPDDFEGMKKEIKALILNKKYYKTCSINSMTVANLYSFDKCFKAISNIYDKI